MNTNDPESFPRFKLAGKGIASRYLAWAVGGVSLALTLLLWQAIRQSDARRTGMLTQLQAENLASELKRKFEVRAQALGSIVAHWEKFGRPNAEEWAFDTKLFVEGHPGYQSIGWVDAQYRLRWFIPHSPFEDSIQKALRTEPRRYTMLARAFKEKRAVVSQLLTLHEGGRGIRLAWPIFRRGVFDGFIVGAFRLDRVFSSFVPPQSAEGYAFSVWDHDEMLLASDDREKFEASPYAKSIDISIYGTQWVLRVWPLHDSRIAGHSAISWVVLFGGILLSLLTGVATRLAQNAGRRIQETEALRRRELELRERASSNRKLSALMEAAPDPMVVLDSQYRIDTGNSALTRFFGYSLSELKGQSVLLLFQEESRSDSSPELRLFLNGAQNFWMRRADGSLFAADVAISSTTTDEGFFRVASIRDVTERHRAEAALAKRSQELERSNHHLENFASMASHDLQEPLRMITMYLGLIEKKYRPLLDEQGQEFVHFCVDASQRLNSMIRGLLVISKVSDPSGPGVQQIESDDLVKEVLGDLRMAVQESNAEIAVSHLPAVWAQRMQLHQVFQNLVANAIKFRRDDTALRIEIKSRRIGPATEFSVSDNGIGFEMRYAERVFGVFQKLNSRDKYPGTGLGLALCRRIIDLHGGRIWARSEPGCGSTFFFTIPDRGLRETVPSTASFLKSEMGEHARTRTV